MCRSILSHFLYIQNLNLNFLCLRNQFINIWQVYYRTFSALLKKHWCLLMQGKGCMQAKNGENWRMGFWLFTHTTRVRGTFRNRELDKKDISRNEWTKLHFPLCLCFLVELLPTCKTLQTAKGFRFSESECPLSHLSHSLFAHSPSVPNQPHFPLHSLQSQVNTQPVPFSYLRLLSHFIYVLSICMHRNRK